MQTLWIEKKIKYDGSQLKPLYAYMNHGVRGNSVVAFAGACDVTFEHMIDAEDLVVRASIKSDLMLHFIVEVFDQSLLAGVVLQRLLVSILHMQLSSKGLQITRDGDDLYIQNKKLSVSIASRSAVSLMIHLGLNITNDGTPVETCSLTDLGLKPEAVAQDLVAAFASEFKSIIEATQKVRPLGS